MLDPRLIQEAANRLDAAERSRQQVRQFSLDYPDIAIEDAYAIQRAWVERKIADGRVLKGHKIGLTSRAMQVSSNISERAASASRILATKSRRNYSPIDGQETYESSRMRSSARSCSHEGMSWIRLISCSRRTQRPIGERTRLRRANPKAPSRSRHDSTTPRSQRFVLRWETPAGSSPRPQALWASIGRRSTD